jgi:hypothetical protein
MVARASGEARREQAVDVVGAHRPVGVTALVGGDLDERLEPEQPT